MSIPAHIEHTFKALLMIERACSPASADTAHKSYVTSQGQKDVPHAGLGSVEAGISAKGDRELAPVIRYWTVKFRRIGRAERHFDHVIACDPWKATMVVMKRDQSIAEAEVVREIQHDEFEHLTRKSP